MTKKDVKKINHHNMKPEKEFGEFFFSWTRRRNLGNLFLVTKI